MSELLKDIDDAWFSDADEFTPAPPVSPALEALGLEISNLPPGSLTPMPMPGHRRLKTEDGNEFSRPNLAVGTVVDARSPKVPWFSDLRSLVPRQRARPSSLPPIPTRARTRRIKLALEAPVALEPVEVAEAPARKSWWRRRK